MGDVVLWLASMRKTKTALAIVALGAFAFSTVAASSPPPAPVTIILQPGDDLPQYDGDLDRVEIRAVPGSHVVQSTRFWPSDTPGRVEALAVTFFTRGDLRIRAGNHLDYFGEPMELWFGGSWSASDWWRVSAPGTVVDDPQPAIGIWPEPVVFPTADTYEVLVGPNQEHPQWWHDTGTAANTTYGANADAIFRGTGMADISWDFVFDCPVLYRPQQHQREIPRVYTRVFVEIEVTYFPL